MQQRQERDFAYGCNNYGEHPCPAMAAGFAPDSGDNSTPVAEEYDTILREQCVSDEGMVSEPIAKDAWLKALERMESRRNTATDDEEWEYYDDLLTVGRAVADELGWL